MSKKAFLYITGVLLLILAVAGCSSDEKPSSSSSNEKTDERTLTHAEGEITLPDNPERILAPYLEDSLIALDEKPVAQWSLGETVLDYLQPQLKDVPKIGWDLPLEQTLEQNPDLIIFSSPSIMQNGSYEDYSAIAPTYVYEQKTSADWRDQLTTMGEILDKEEKAEQVLTDFDQKVEEASDKLKDSIGDESVAFIWTMGEQFYVFDKNRYGVNIFYDDMGIAQPEFIQNLPEQGEEWNPISLEKLGQLDADHVFLIGNEGEPGFEILENSSVWQNTPAAKNNQVYQMNDPSHWTIDGAIAHEMTIDQVVETLRK
ncbi:iron-hydroxamate ABC transporter substrate-binding protein [Halobacillus karajensis]|uniref:Siderophore-binding lipoprotein YfiY n=1 Tax=Halobacillus karajensis TaxID=195088 RepID=A0A024PAD4_9BACI|nr:iron-hydroxamate ABC transporter substrate-binding protein [Halobacillus karajensis]CDQ21452.1 putative siderophore-binding lipoprotein YfiY precursor [Halobacillus karajensis]CDQ25387.1 putative siderophore-binding lipoprotein YfiY precursor [Halobacillus karajensis]CDQ29711.1 putative siderophore-binding lipoprotein YfiY precursor [Halobacillus karajensis]